MDTNRTVEENFFKMLAGGLDQAEEGHKYRIIANLLEAEIQAGRLKANQRLPTVRELSEQLRVSATTVSGAYKFLTQRGLIESKVGSGTRVADFEPEARVAAIPVSALRGASPWRRRTQTTHIHRLQTAFPKARNYASGTPNLDLLPVAVLKRAWLEAADGLSEGDLGYAGPRPVEGLANALVKRLEADLVPARPADMMVGSSAQQLITLGIRSVAQAGANPRLLIAVEEPGYPTIFDTFERLGHKLIGVRIDEEGVVPSSLEAALRSGANAVLLTPRAQNPTGVSWSTARREELANVLAEHPNVVVIEDDQFADATQPSVGSLLSDARLEDRVIYIRSFSKTIAPDLRLAVAVARPPLRALLMEEKFFADGWSSRLSQVALAHAFNDADLEDALNTACNFYASQRSDITQAILSKLAGTIPVRIPPSAGSVNIWIQLPQNTSAAEVAERAAAAGFLVATGEPFFVDIGRDDALRLNAGMVMAEEAVQVGNKLASAIMETVNSTSELFLHHNL